MIVLNSFWIFVSFVVINTNAKSIEIDDNDASWEEYKREYNRVYLTIMEEQKRKEIFIQNSKLIKDHNAQNHTFKLKMNQFGDLTHEEFIHNLSSTPETPINQNDLDDDSTVDDTLLFDGNNRAQEAPPAIDLRQEGWVSEVKNQGDRSNTFSWAFSLAGAIEAQIFKPIGNCPKQPVQSLSESFLIDCRNENEVGTGFEQAVELVRKRGIYTEKLYKLVKHMNGNCPEEDFPIRASVRFKELTRKLADKNVTVKIKKELFGFQNSVPAQVDASHQSFQFYHTGIYAERKCNTESSTANQAVLIVGYNETDRNSKHWLVKNSWGKDWGEEGYMKIAYETCGIEKQAYTISAKRKFCDCEEIP